MDNSLGWLWIGLVMFAYLIPGIVASSRKTLNSAQVWVVNLFLGWTFLGWVVALSMAMSHQVEGISDGEQKEKA